MQTFTFSHVSFDLQDRALNDVDGLRVKVEGCEKSHGTIYLVCSSNF